MICNFTEISLLNILLGGAPHAAEYLLSVPAIHVLYDSIYKFARIFLYLHFNININNEELCMQGHILLLECT